MKIGLMLTLNQLNFLTVVFVILKLTGSIAWSWFWVLFPSIISLGIAIVLGIIALGIFILAAFFVDEIEVD